MRKILLQIFIFSVLFIVTFAINRILMQNSFIPTGLVSDKNEIFLMYLLGVSSEDMIQFKKNSETFALNKVGCRKKIVFSILTDVETKIFPAYRHVVIVINKVKSSNTCLSCRSEESS